MTKHKRDSSNLRSKRDSSGEKLCTKCGDELPFQSFGWNPGSKTGWNTYCTNCRNLGKRKARQRERVRFKQYEDSVINTAITADEVASMERQRKMDLDACRRIDVRKALIRSCS